MARTQKLDPASPPLSPPSEIYSFDPWPGLSAWPLSHLKSSLQRVSVCKEAVHHQGRNLGWAGLCINATVLANLFCFPWYWKTTLEAAQSPAWATSPEQRKPELVPLSLFLAPPPWSVPRKLLLFPEPVQLEGWERETVCQTLQRDFQKLGWGNRL